MAFFFALLSIHTDSNSICLFHLMCDVHPSLSRSLSLLLSCKLENQPNTDTHMWMKKKNGTSPSIWNALSRTVRAIQSNTLTHKNDRKIIYKSQLNIVSRFLVQFRRRCFCSHLFLIFLCTFLFRLVIAAAAVVAIQFSIRNSIFCVFFFSLFLNRSVLFFQIVSFVIGNLFCEIFYAILDAFLLYQIFK